MKFAPLAAALSLAAAPAIAQAEPPPRDALAMICAENIGLIECLQIAQDASTENKMPVFTKYTYPTGEVRYMIVENGMALVLGPEDVIRAQENSKNPPLQRPAPTL